MEGQVTGQQAVQGSAASAQPGAASEPSSSSATTGQQSQSGQSGQQSQQAPPWGGTFKSEGDMWNGYRELQSHTTKTKQELNQLRQQYEQMQQQQSEFQQQNQDYSQKWQKLQQAISGQDPQAASELQRVQLAERLLQDPDAVINERVNQILQKVQPEFMKQHLDPLRQELESRRYAETNQQRQDTMHQWQENYGGEFCDHVAEQVQQESQQLGPEWLQLHQNPVVFDMRLRNVYLENHFARIQDAIAKNDTATLRTLLAKENASPPQGQATMPSGQSPSYLQNYEREMDEAGKTMMGR